MAQSETQRQIEVNRNLVREENDRLARQQQQEAAEVAAQQAAKEWK